MYFPSLWVTATFESRSNLLILYFNNLLKYASLTMLNALMNGILKLFSYSPHPAYREEESLDKYFSDK